MMHDRSMQQTHGEPASLRVHSIHDCRFAGFLLVVGLFGV